MPITIQPGPNELSVQLTPVPVELASLWGFITDAVSAAPIQGALVEITGPGGTYQATSLQNGSYGIDNIVPGTYAGSITHPDYVDYII